MFKCNNGQMETRRQAFSSTCLIIAFSIISVILSGCVRDPDPVNPIDPYEKYNRRIFALNVAFDKAIMQPAAVTYHFLVPPPIRARVRNWFSNVGEIVCMANHLLQADLRGGLINLNRFAINSTLGIGGLFDVANWLGLKPARTSFNATLIKWGVDQPRYYIMIPFIGPTTDRGLVGILMDRWILSPFAYLDNWYLSFSLVGGNYLQARETGLAASRILYSSFDPYVFMRDAYWQHMELNEEAGGMMPVKVDEKKDPDDFSYELEDDDDDDDDNGDILSISERKAGSDTVEGISL